MPTRNKSTSIAPKLSHLVRVFFSLYFVVRLGWVGVRACGRFYECRRNFFSSFETPAIILGTSGLIGKSGVGFKFSMLQVAPPLPGRAKNLSQTRCGCPWAAVNIHILRSDAGLWHRPTDQQPPRGADTANRSFFSFFFFTRKQFRMWKNMGNLKYMQPIPRAIRLFSFYQF